MAKKGRQKANQKLLRVCHKYLVDEDGYDIGIQDLVKSLSKEYDTYVTTFLTKAGLAEYVKKNKLTKKNGHYYHTQTGAYVLPIFYTRRHGVYVTTFLKGRTSKALKSSMMPCSTR
ncbi:hypothetical protein KY362_02405 [Candidatus Woesearchaeota archaeon]|nr:hypothetical protein [Candidatus Woesearchaeota archaeon]